MEITLQSTELAIDVLKGLTSNQKYLNSKYFYDARGSRIFQKIMNMPEYYLTNCEEEIFHKQKQLIYESFLNNKKPFEIVELGAGDGIKTKILLDYFLKQGTDFSYIPIDISEEAVLNLINDLENELPELEVKGKIGDYFQMMEELSKIDKTQKILLFLGSNIGNFNEQETIKFLNHLRKVMNPVDKLFIGFDLKKDTDIIIRAYDDPHGYTASFNLNLLRRINDELGANFELLKFKHHEVYDPQSGTAKSFLVSQEKQMVYIGAIEAKIYFEKWEPIFMEMSQKYDLHMIKNLADASGFEILRNFSDSRQYFLNSLWKLKQ